MKSDKKHHKPGRQPSPWASHSYQQECSSVHKLRVDCGRSCKDCIYSENCFEYPERFIDLIFKYGEPAGCEAIKRMAPITIAGMRDQIKFLTKEVIRLAKEVMKYEEKERTRSEASGGIPEGSEESRPEDDPT